MTVVDLLWQQARERLYITREQFEQSLEGWFLDTIHGPNGIAIVFVVKGPMFHFAKFDPTVKATRDHLRKYPGSLIAKYGYATTTTPKEDTRQRRFNERLGFFQTGEDDLDIHYRIEKLKFKEQPSCQ
jgi:hypothetical protein